MTTKELMQAIINGTTPTEEMKSKATEVIASIDKKNGKRTEKSAENRSANSAIAVAIAAKMNSNTTYAVSELHPLILADYPEISKSKVSTVMGVGVEDGLFTVVNDYKVGGKGRKVNGYTKVTTEDTDTEDIED